MRWYTCKSKRYDGYVGALCEGWAATKTRDVTVVIVCGIVLSLKRDLCRELFVLGEAVDAELCKKLDLEAESRHWGSVVRRKSKC